MQFEGVTPEELKKDFPEHRIQSVKDTFEQWSERASDLELQRLFWSNYKQHSTVKSLAESATNGCVVHVSDAFPGSCTDADVCKSSGLQSRLYKGMASLADKGFPLHAEAAEQGHEWITPPRKFQQLLGFTVDEVKWTNRVAKHRGLIERVIGCGRTWKYMDKTIKVADTRTQQHRLTHQMNQVDICGTATLICMMMTNYEGPLKLPKTPVVVHSCQFELWGP